MSCSAREVSDVLLRGAARASERAACSRSEHALSAHFLDADEEGRELINVLRRTLTYVSIPSLRAVGAGESSSHNMWFYEPFTGPVATDASAAVGECADGWSSVGKSY